ncbi:Glucanosyltransferase-domain-containing protein [Papiliotrema laurentii]|uniref:1,3-beta-glucanosyltransferase n=1 Tax=Papiliotrema laurentii TaxID=5418 RepID=A0AAD9CXC0_PAPLA|nr:Glucanosyltransferase-domain-containing protein [Papiliotrema laurentii]
MKWASIAPLAFAVGTSALPQITRTGKYLYDPQGTRFFIKGVAYQPQGELAADSAANQANGGFPEPSSYIDPLSSAQNCTRDLPYLRQLGVNAVRVYSVDPANNHDECMKAFDDAGIYVLLDVSLPLNGSIDRSSPSWTTNLLDEYTRTIDAFNKYDNVLGYNIGNEVVNTAGNTNAAPFVKAAARDVKAYLGAIGSKALVGYAAVDGDADFRNNMAEYMTCGDEADLVDLYGLNNYEWCGNSTLASSGWQAITTGFQNIPVATYMSEFGCIFSPPRVWNEVAALYSSPVSDVFSGGVAFSYFPTSDGYGMVTFSGNGQSVQTSDDFRRLAAEYNSTATPTGPARSSASQGRIDCPPENSSFLANNTLPPTPDEQVCNCIDQNAFACKVKNSTANQPAVVGSLLDYACSLLGQSRSTACNAIAGNGTSGVYGPLAMCSPAIKLSYAMSAYFSLNPIASSCDFGGNATIVQNGPNTSKDASDAAASCLAKQPASGVFTPSPSSAGPSSTGSSSPSGASSAAAQSTGAATASIQHLSVGGLAGLMFAVLGMGAGARIVL